MDSPAGKTSVKAMPVSKMFPCDVLLIVNLRVDILPLMIGFVKKDFVIVGGGEGTLQPVKVMTSYCKPAPLLSFFAPDPLILMVVAPVVLVKFVKLIFPAVHAAVGGGVSVPGGRVVKPDPLSYETVKVVGPLEGLEFIN